MMTETKLIGRIEMGDNTHLVQNEGLYKSHQDLINTFTFPSNSIPQIRSRIKKTIMDVLTISKTTRINIFTHLNCILRNIQVINFTCSYRGSPFACISLCLIILLYLFIIVCVNIILILESCYQLILLNIQSLNSKAKLGTCFYRAISFLKLRQY